ncbi:MAG: hypothetical protein AAFO69_20525, partial [Bacteroidota bacterium]
VAGFGTVASQLFVGGYPRIGLQYRRFNLIAAYNIIPRLQEDVEIRELSNLLFSRKVEVNNSYFSVKAGVVIGKDL